MKLRKTPTVIIYMITKKKSLIPEFIEAYKEKQTLRTGHNRRNWRIKESVEEKIEDCLKFYSMRNVNPEQVVECMFQMWNLSFCEKVFTLKYPPITVFNRKNIDKAMSKYGHFVKPLPKPKITRVIRNQLEYFDRACVIKGKEVDYGSFGLGMLHHNIGILTTVHLIREERILYSKVIKILEEFGQIGYTLFSSKFESRLRFYKKSEEGKNWQ